MPVIAVKKPYKSFAPGQGLPVIMQTGTDVTDQQKTSILAIVAALPPGTGVEIYDYPFPAGVTLKENLTADQVGVAGGVAPLDANSKVPAANLPDIAASGATVLVSEVPLNASRYSSLQAAANAIPASGGSLFIPAGTYTGDVTFKPKTRVVGAGREATIIVGSVKVNAAESNVISDLTIQAPAQNGLTGLALLGGAHRTQVERVNILDFTGTGLRLEASGGVPAFYNAFRDIDIVNSRGGGRGIFIETMAASDWITACRFENVTARGTTTAKFAQGINLSGPGTINHIKWEDIYLEYVSYEGWYFGPKAGFQTMNRVTTEDAGTAYYVDGPNYITAIDVNQFSCATGWYFANGSTGHRVLGPQMARIDGDVSFSGNITGITSAMITGTIPDARFPASMRATLQGAGVTVNPDTITASGWYYWSPAANLPDTTAGATPDVAVLAIVYGGGFSVQTAFDWRTNKTWRRSQSGVSWSAWERLTTGTEVAAKLTKPASVPSARIPVRVKQAGGAYPSTAGIDRSLYYVDFLGPLDPWTAPADGQPGDAHSKTTAEVP